MEYENRTTFTIYKYFYVTVYSMFRFVIMIKMFLLYIFATEGYGCQ